MTTDYIDDLLTEAKSTNKSWESKISSNAPNSVPFSGINFQAGEASKLEVNRLGDSYGCHTCNLPLNQVPNTFIVDHIPPRGIFSGETQKRRGKYVFFPHCDECAGQQSALVKGISPLTTKYLTDWNGVRTDDALADIRAKLKSCGYADAKSLALLTGGVGASIKGHSGNPNAVNIRNINALPGVACHSCGSVRANKIWHADHCPPSKLAQSGFVTNAIKDAAKANPDDERYTDYLKLMEAMYFRPQCGPCSHRQGQRCKKLVEKLKDAVMSSSPTTVSSRKRTVQRVDYSPGALQAKAWRPSKKPK